MDSRKIFPDRAPVRQAVGSIMLVRPGPGQQGQILLTQRIHVLTPEGCMQDIRQKLRQL